MRVVDFKSKKPFEYEYAAFREITENDVMEAASAAGITSNFQYRINGQHEDFIRFILSKTCLFDGKTCTPEELKRLSPDRLAELAEIITIKIRWEIYRNNINHLHS